MPAADLTDLHVILVDDDEAAAGYAAEVLLPDRVRVDAFRRAEPALAAARHSPPDLAIFDLELPGMSGFEATRLLREHARTRQVPVLVLSGFGDPRSRIAAFACGADCFLPKPFAQDELRAIVRSLGRRGHLLHDVEQGEAVLLALAEIVDLRCLDARGHMERSAGMARAFGRLLGLSEPDQRALERAGYLHDIGKVGVPWDVLNKPGGLTEAERLVMQQHPLIGVRICERLQTLKSVLPIIRHHHERWDGSGYPDHLAGEAIPFLARAFQVVDVYEALVSPRCYKDPMSSEKALATLQAETAAGAWDVSLVELFAQAVTQGLLRQ